MRWLSGTQKKTKNAKLTRGQCVTCNMKTEGWCIIYRQSLCTILSKVQKDEPTWPKGVVLDGQYYVNSCFFAKHLPAVIAAADVMTAEMRDALE